MEAPEDLRCLARNGLREMAARDLKARGPGKDGGLPPAGHGGSFAGGSCKEIREITSEIEMLGLHGAGHQRPQERHVLRAPAGEDFLGAGTGVHHVCGIQPTFRTLRSGFDIFTAIDLVN